MTKCCFFHATKIHIPTNRPVAPKLSLSRSSDRIALARTGRWMYGSGNIQNAWGDLKIRPRVRHVVMPPLSDTEFACKSNLFQGSCWFHVMLFFKSGWDFSETDLDQGNSLGSISSPLGTRFPYGHIVLCLHLHNQSQCLPNPQESICK